jgi:hypothetical protein
MRAEGKTRARALCGRAERRVWPCPQEEQQPKTRITNTGRKLNSAHRRRTHSESSAGGKLKQLEVMRARHCPEAEEKNQDFATHRLRAWSRENKSDRRASHRQHLKTQTTKTGLGQGQNQASIESTPGCDSASPFKKKPQHATRT